MHWSAAAAAPFKKKRTKKNRVGPVDPPGTGPFETDRVRFGSKTENLFTRFGPARYNLKRVGPVPSKLGPARPVPTPSGQHLLLQQVNVNQSTIVEGSSNLFTK